MQNHRLIFAGILVLSAWTASACPLGQSFAPRAEFRGNTELEAFHTRLRDVVAKRDVEAFLSLVSSEISWTFGADEPGKIGFVKSWQLDGDGAAKSRLWAELEQALALGGAADEQGNFCFPHVASELWPNSCDPMETGAIIARDVRVRATPTAKGVVAARVSEEIVALRNDKSKGDWVALDLGKGRTGYVRHDLVRRPIGYRGCFTKQKDAVVLNVFIAGD